MEISRMKYMFQDIVYEARHERLRLHIKENIDEENDGQTDRSYE